MALRPKKHWSVREARVFTRYRASPRGPAAEMQALNEAVAQGEGQILPVHVARADGNYPLEWLVQERSVTTNTTATSGNANLMMLG